MLEILCLFILPLVCSLLEFESIEVQFYLKSFPLNRLTVHVDDVTMFMNLICFTGACSSHKQLQLNEQVTIGYLHIQ